MTGQLSDKINEINTRLNEINSKITLNRQPIAPKKPNPPTLKFGNPKFFKIGRLVVSFLLCLAIIMYLNAISEIFGYQKLYSEQQFSNVIILTSAIALIIRISVYMKEYNLYTISKNAYKIALVKYEENLNSYETLKFNYEDALVKYQYTNASLKSEKAKFEKELKDIYSYMSKNLFKLSEKDANLYFERLQNYTSTLNNSIQSLGNIPLIELEPNEMKKDPLVKGVDFISKLSRKQKEYILNLLFKVQKIQNSNLSSSQKSSEIKRILWSDQSPGSKLLIGGFLGTILGLIVFGTGGIGIVGLGGAVGVWGFLAGTAGGVLISSIIQNFENSNRK